MLFIDNKQMIPKEYIVTSYPLMNGIDEPYSSPDGWIIEVIDSYAIDLCKLLNLESPSAQECYDSMTWLRSGSVINPIIPQAMLEIIATNPYVSYIFSNILNGGRFELGEPAIATDAKYSYLYARDVIKGRFELGEPIISTYVNYSYQYANEVLKGRFELGEPIIATDTYCSYAYATSVIGRRFHLCEDNLRKTDKDLYRSYMRKFNEKSYIKSAIMFGIGIGVLIATLVF